MSSMLNLTNMSRKICLVQPLLHLLVQPFFIGSRSIKSRKKKIIAKSPVPSVMLPFVVVKLKYLVVKPMPLLLT